MASRTPGKDRPFAGRRTRPSLAQRVMSALVPSLLDAWAEALLAGSREAGGTTPVRPHWEDAVDMDAAAPPFRKNPSSWPHRITVAVSLIAIRVRFLRIVIIAIGLSLIGYGYVAGGYPPAPGSLNLIVIGVLLGVLGLVPTDCLQPTHSWRDYYASQRRQ